MGTVLYYFTYAVIICAIIVFVGCVSPYPSSIILSCWWAFWIFFISLTQYLIFKIKKNELAWKNLKGELYWFNVLSVTINPIFSLILGFVVYGALGGCVDVCTSYNGYFVWAGASFIFSSFYTLFKQLYIFKLHEPTHLKWIVIVSTLIMNLIMYETIAMFMFFRQ